ncbi:hypothetical protein [endosymbiont GvMRE of Glomus versiforme]|uniref:hypothetical protein n=1 Tax=endosymbiont GvMRE of Glomus versiforme TaxID=2039283 RepID=UPI000EC56DF2|nr:hypothetical protein [endosymbiont GvMRE of Glomus versiforme]RHZ35444.1 hypothetical protein GvMRE_IIg569 [endosymbiont GvMRE of Glomus versiforme]
MKLKIEINKKLERKVEVSFDNFKIGILKLSIIKSSLLAGEKVEKELKYSDNKKTLKINKVKEIWFRSHVKLIEKINRLISFKEALVEKRNSAVNEDGNKLIVIIENFQNVFIAKDNCIEFKDDCFYEKTTLEIDSININISSNKKKIVPEDFNGDVKDLSIFKLAFSDLEKLLDSLEAKYKIDTKIKSIDIKADIDNLNHYLVKNNDLDDNPEKILYNLNTSEGELYYNKNINWWIKLLSELEVWKAGGFDTIEEVLKANANGFHISSNRCLNLTIGDGKLVEKKSDGITDDNDSKNNIKEITKVIKNKELFGFKMFENDQEIETLDFVNDDKNYFKSLFGVFFKASKKIDYSARQLTIFRSKEWFGAEHDGINYINRRLPRQCRGFKPSDIKVYDSYGNHGESMKDLFKDSISKGKRITKIAKDIWYAPSLKEAINLAFFGKHYFENPFSEEKNGTIRLDERYWPRLENNSSSLLYFNEVEEWSKLETLEFYYDAIKSIKCAGSEGGVYDKNTNNLDGKNEWGNRNGYLNNRKSKEIIDKAYNIVKKFLEIIDKTYIYKHEWKNDKKELTKYLKKALESPDSFEGMIGEHWKNEINKKINSINENLLIDDDRTWKNRDIDIQNEIKKDGIRNSDKAKNAFVCLFNKAKDKNVFDRLKHLIPVILKAELESEIFNDVKFESIKQTLTSLKFYRSADKNSLEGIAWKHVNTERGGLGKDWAKSVWDSLELKSNELLSNAKRYAENKIKPKEACTKILSNTKIKNDPDKIKLVADIFEKCTEIWEGRIKIDKESKKRLEKELKNLKQANEDNWNSINEWKSTSNEKYADGALEKISNKNGDNEWSLEEFLEEKTANDFDEKKELVLSIVSLDEKNFLEDILFPILRKFVENNENLDINQIDQKEKEFVKIFSNLSTTQKDISSLGEEELNKIKEQINKFETAEINSEKNKIWNKYSEVRTNISNYKKEINNRIAEIIDKNDPEALSREQKIFIGTLIIAISAFIAFILYHKKDSKKEEKQTKINDHDAF